MTVSMQKRPCDMQNFDLWLFICSKVQHTGYIFLITFSLFGRNHTKKCMYKNTSSFLAVSFVVLMSNVTLSFFHQTMNFFLTNNMYPVISVATTCRSTGLDSGLKILFPTETLQSTIILNCLQIGNKTSCSIHVTLYCGFTFVLWL